MLFIQGHSVTAESLAAHSAAAHLQCRRNVELFSHRYSGARCISLKKRDLSISCSDFVMLSLKTLPSHSNSLCLHFAEFALFLLKMHVGTQIYCGLHRFPAIKIRLSPSHSGCPCSLAKLLLSDLCSALGFFFFSSWNNPVKNAPTKRRPVALWTNEKNPSTLQAYLLDLLTRFINSYPPGFLLKCNSQVYVF